MTDQPKSYIDKGLIHFCERGRILFDIYHDKIFDEDIEPAEKNEAWSAWKEHKVSCGECGYV